MRRGDWRTDLVVVLCAALVPICVGAAQSNERVIYVDGAAMGAGDGSSWIDAYRDLQDALADANEAPPAVIRVAQGTYRPGPPMGATLDSWNATFQLPNRATLEGGYAGVAGTDPNARDVERYRTILSGDLSGDDTPGEDWNVPARQENCRRVVTGTGKDESALIDGFTVTGATGPAVDMKMKNSAFRRCCFVDNAQAGIHTWRCNSVLTECVFERNRRSWGAFTSSDGDATLTDCVFVDNGGGGIQSTGSLDLLRCSFVANSGAVDCTRQLTARACTFVGNTGWRAAVSAGGSVTLVDCRFLGNSASRMGPGALGTSGDSVRVSRCLFAGNTTRGIGSIAGGAIENHATVMKLANCVFAGNSGGPFGPGAIFTSMAILEISNCTFVDNRGQPASVLMYAILPGARAELTRNIVRDGPEPFTSLFGREPQILVTYSNIEGGYEGRGNFDSDPLFVDPGHWDPNGTPEDPDDDVYVVGDYHLKSQAGHWDRATETWVFDEVTSPCIDAGDPNAPLGAEPFPNGGFVNMGAYGGTSEASRSYFGEPVCETHIAGDINGDCKVDDLDMDILLSHWLMPDIGRANIPPTVVLTSPEDGAELAYPMPIILRAEASDVDGTVLTVRYMVEYRSETSRGTTGLLSTDPTDGWRREVNWSNIHYDSVYTIWAEATDNDGAVTISPKIHVTLHP